MVTIPAGKVSMRDDRVNQQWDIEIKSFLMAQVPVTQDWYQDIMDANPSSFQGGKLPVESVSWIDAVQFCNKLSEISNLETCYLLNPGEDTAELLINKNGFRLPLEAEWQYACQASLNEIRYDTLDEIAWYKSNSKGTTQEVGQKHPNAFGLYDMLGNVWEWCSDIYDESVYGSYRIFRGGGWCDEERSVMATTRRRSHPTSFKIDDLGFRVARNSQSDS